MLQDPVSENQIRPLTQSSSATRVVAALLPESWRLWQSKAVVEVGKLVVFLHYGNDEVIGSNLSPYRCGPIGQSISQANEPAELPCMASHALEVKPITQTPI